jgi:hypothetical protein
MAPGTALGFFWALGGICNHSFSVPTVDPPSATAERKELYRFSADMGKLALCIAEKYGGNGEKWYGHRLVGILDTNLPP